ncbi:hypothetical protein [Synechococcus sp. GFB01]|uniref:hypothetical protein n=1 Tax=Synechococcus sp. GFB01 TaxID=1662190 RepID=UPI00064E9CC5|nr:hypothetical protein [Synechococcus sp. GFB01]KMM17386.1 hypothetical protein SYNGFB01_04455 [Synechococcus sp. GFB01]
MTRRADPAPARRWPLWVSGVVLVLVGQLLSGWKVHHFALTALALDYHRLGFVKRGLLGTLLGWLLPERLPLQQAQALWIGQGMLVGAALALLLVGLTRCRQGSLVRVAWLSPALFLQAGYNFSFLDGLLLVCCSLALLLLEGTGAMARWRGLLVIAAATCGALFHESFLLAFLPLLVLRAWRRRPAIALALLGSALLVGLLLVVQGGFEAGPAVLQERLAERFAEPFAANTVELTSSLGQNLTSTAAALKTSGLIKALPGFLYLALLLASVATSSRQATGFTLAACLAPLLLLPLGTDSSRWIGFACFNLLLMGLAGDLQFRLPPRRQALLLMFTCLGPLGIQGSFPLLGSALRNLYPLPP